MSTRGASRTTSWGPVPIRLMVGLIFLLHGGQKLFVIGLGGVAGFMAQIGIPLPGIAAVAVTAVEFLGGLALLVGLGTRVAAPFLTVAMVVALLSVARKEPFFGGYELNLVLIGATLSLALLGSGTLSLDGILRRDRRRSEG
jgi:putative oxidoreductase